MSKAPAPPPRNPGGRIATIALGLIFVAALVVLVVLSVTHQSGPAAVSASPTPQATPSAPPTPSETPGIHFKTQGHPGHDKTSPTDPAVVGFKYNSDPPTSGMHLEGFTGALINEQPLPKYMQVHLLEHGNVLLQYNCNCPDIAGALAQIASLYNNRQLPQGQTAFTPDIVQTIEERGSGVIVAPYPPMKYKIALTAWTRLESFDKIDEPSMVRFINAYLTNQSNAMQ